MIRSANSGVSKGRYNVLITSIKNHGKIDENNRNKIKT